MLTPKQTRIRNKAYRKFVASLPCYLCGIQGASQAAHIHEKMKKTMSKKESDDCIIPLCHEGANNCHKSVDKYEVELDRPGIIKKAQMAYSFWKAKKITDAMALLRGV